MEDNETNDKAKQIENRLKSGMTWQDAVFNE